MATDRQLDYDGPLAGARVLVVDDEELTVRALQRVLTECRAKSICCRGVRDARVEIEEAALPFDAAVVDYQLVQGDGIEIIEVLRSGRYPCAALMITGSHDPEKGRRAIRAGADNFMLKPFDVVEFVQNLEEIVSANRARRRRIADTPWDPSRRQSPPFVEVEPVAALRAVGDELRSSRADVPDLEAQVERISAAATLSRREREVLYEILKGQKNTDISAELGITTRTVKFHVRNVLKKCQVDGRSGLTGLLWKEETLAPAPPVEEDAEPPSP